MLHLAKSGGTYVLRCDCGCYNLSFVDDGIDFEGSLRCLMCGEEESWARLIGETHGHGERRGAEIYVLSA